MWICLYIVICYSDSGGVKGIGFNNVGICFKICIVYVVNNVGLSDCE